MLGKNHIKSNFATLFIVYSFLMSIQTIVYKVSLNPLVQIVLRLDVIEKFIYFYTQPLGLETISLCISLFWLGSLLSDIDNKSSTLGRYIRLPIEHRTWTHTIWFVLLLLFFSFFYPPLIWLTFGCFLHIFWDSFSPAGICWFYPLSQYVGVNGHKVKPRHWLHLYRSNSISEQVLVGFLIFVATLCVGLTFQSEIYKFFHELLSLI